MKQDDYDAVSHQVRSYIAQKLVALEDTLRPYINGELGDITPGHINAYIALLKELGRLYEVQRRPRDPETLIPISKVEAILAAENLRRDKELQAAVEAAEARVRGELESKAATSLESARTQVLDRLRQLR